MPVKTNFLPSNTPATAPLIPGRGMLNLAFLPARGMMADVDAAFAWSRATIALLEESTLAAAGFGFLGFAETFGCGLSRPSGGGGAPTDWYADPANMSLVNIGRPFNS